jgi:ssDNA-binding Zn-finger/Zn-ribbon topoisomerase 1
MSRLVTSRLHKNALDADRCIACGKVGAHRTAATEGEYVTMTIRGKEYPGVVSKIDNTGIIITLEDGRILQLPHSHKSSALTEERALDMVKKLEAQAESAAKIGNPEEAKTFADKAKTLRETYKLNKPGSPIADPEPPVLTKGGPSGPCPACGGKKVYYTSKQGLDFDRPETFDKVDTVHCSKCEASWPFKIVYTARAKKATFGDPNCGTCEGHGMIKGERTGRWLVCPKCVRIPKKANDDSYMQIWASTVDERIPLDFGGDFLAQSQAAAEYSQENPQALVSVLLYEEGFTTIDRYHAGQLMKTDEIEGEFKQPSSVLKQAGRLCTCDQAQGPHHHCQTHDLMIFTETGKCPKCEAVDVSKLAREPMHDDSGAATGLRRRPDYGESDSYTSEMNEENSKTAGPFTNKVLLPAALGLGMLAPGAKETKPPKPPTPITQVQEAPAAPQPLDPEDVTAALRTASKATGIPLAVLSAIAHNETRYGQDTSQGGSGSNGFMQMTPDALAEVNKVYGTDYIIEDMDDPDTAALAAAQYLHILLKKFDKDLDATIAAYNTGPKHVNQVLEKYGEITPETLAAAGHNITSDYLMKAKARMGPKKGSSDFPWPIVDEEYEHEGTDAPCEDCSHIKRKTSGPVGQDVFPDGQVDFFEPVRDMHSVEVDPEVKAKQLSIDTDYNSLHQPGMPVGASEEPKRLLEKNPYYAQDEDLPEEFYSDKPFDVQRREKAPTWEPEYKMGVPRTMVSRLIAARRGKRTLPKAELLIWPVPRLMGEDGPFIRTTGFWGSESEKITRHLQELGILEAKKIPETELPALMKMLYDKLNSDPELIVSEQDSNVLPGNKEITVKVAGVRPAEYGKMPHQFGGGRCVWCGLSSDDKNAFKGNCPNRETEKKGSAKKRAGATDFSAVSKGKSVQDAFQNAVAEARAEARSDAEREGGQYEGYSGSIAEKNNFVVLTPPKGIKPLKWAEWVMSGTFGPEEPLKDVRQVEYKDGQKCPQKTYSYGPKGKQLEKGCSGTISLKPEQVTYAGRTWTETKPKCSAGHHLSYQSKGTGENAKFYYSKAYKVKDEYTNQIRSDAQRVNDKWGPAGAVQLSANTWYFFGYASS